MYLKSCIEEVNRMPQKGKQDQAYNAFWYSISINQQHHIPHDSKPLSFDKVQSVLAIHDIDTARLVGVAHSVAFLSHHDHLRPERRADKLPTAVRGLRQRLQHAGDCSPVLRIQVGIDFIKKVEWRGIALLDGEDEGKGAETCGCQLRSRDEGQRFCS